MVNQKTVTNWMRVNRTDHKDRRTGEINATSLAEAAAAEFDMNEEGGPLDDETHWIWDAAAEVAST